MWWIGWVNDAEEIWHEMRIMQATHRSPKKRQEVAFEKGVALPTFEFIMYYLSPTPRHLKFHYNRTNCKWVDVTIMSNATMEYDKHCLALFASSGRC